MTLNGNVTLRGDLDAIITRTLRKEPSERYASVSDLEKDIRHYLAGNRCVLVPIPCLIVCKDSSVVIKI